MMSKNNEKYLKRLAYIIIMEEAGYTNLSINEPKRKYLWASRKRGRLWPKTEPLKVNEYTFQRIEQFSPPRRENDWPKHGSKCDTDIQQRLKTANGRFYACSTLLQSKLYYHTPQQIRVYKTITRPTLRYRKFDGE